MKINLFSALLSMFVVGALTVLLVLNWDSLVWRTANIVLIFVNTSAALVNINVFFSHKKLTDK